MGNIGIQIKIRVPDGMRDRIRQRAAVNRRSMNSEIVYHLDRALAAENEEGPAEAATSPGHDHAHHGNGENHEHDER